MKVTLTNLEVTSINELMNAQWNRILTVELPTGRFAIFQEGHGFISQDQDGFYNEGVNDNPTMQYLTREDALNARRQLVERCCGI